MTEGDRKKQRGEEKGEKGKPARPNGRARRKAGARPRRAVARPAAIALGNPLRVRILSEVDRRPLSPGEIAARRGDPVAKVAYHFKVLQECGCIEPAAREEQTPAAERLYRRTERNSD